MSDRFLLPDPERPILLRINEGPGGIREIEGRSQEKLPLEMYQTCKTVHRELIPLEALLKSGALIPTIQLCHVPLKLKKSLEQSDEILQLASHLCFVSVGSSMNCH